MSVRKDVLKKALNIIRERKATAEATASKKQFDLHEACPEIRNIEYKLSGTGAKAAKAVLMGGNTAEILLKLKEENQKLQKEYEKMLADIGFCKEDLEPRYHCKVCKDTGEKGGKMCKCLSNEIKKISHEELNLSTPLSVSSFDDIKEDYYNSFSETQRDTMVKILNYCKNYARNFSTDSPNLLFMGATGLGKTHLSLSIANDAIENGFGVIYGSVHSFSFSIEKERFSDNQSKLDLLLGCELLILDDLGAEFSSAYTNAVLYDIINTRIMKKLPTIISTNFSPKELQDRYGERLISRFFGSYVTLNFVGKDIRMIKKFN